MPQTTTGRCHYCNIRYSWHGRPLRRDALCPRCRNPLRRTNHLWKGATSHLTPLRRERLPSHLTPLRESLP